MSGKNSIQVAIKVRPLSKKEKDQQNCWRIVDNSIQLIDSQLEPYYFDYIFDQDATNQIIFDKMAKQIVHSAIQGFNGTIFAYGQTSSGKTYTMMGDDDNPGVMVLAVKEIFKEIERTQDRQFLLRVGYIEIHNEKIYDLLNKRNHDLKIHETATNIVNVNCKEFIIRSEDDLLYQLNRGGKERTVGETNMNERSSRSHAIFRIIIESRKINRGEDDAIIQSVINLVDLAGSERADQSGARGARLKEGGHINKSLLFLSNVIKSLSENEDDAKYISFRDSKLTRILQASLGGNALTAIICTIKPNAVEETQSTLNFALRAKAIKNKPKVNEIISDATMMKRLEHEIKELKTRLENEQRKNESQIKVRQLEQRIKDEDLKIISYNSLHSIRNREKRRRTWCPSSTSLDASSDSQHASSLPVPTSGPGLLQPSRLQAPKTSHYTPLITMRPHIESPAASKFVNGGLPTVPDNLPEINEEFSPAELVNFEMLSPLQTPRNQQLMRNFSITPKLTTCTQSTLKKVEHDLLELQSFTNLENKTEVLHEPDMALKQKVETLSQRNAVLENERLEYIQLKDEIVITTDNLNETQKRCNELQVQLSKLINSNKEANEKIKQYEEDLAQLKITNEKLEMENREVVNLEFELQRHKNKSKLRECELIEVLSSKEKEITKLEKSLNALNAERLQNSKEELLQKSLNENGEANADGQVCVKCEDLQRLLDENSKVTLEFEKLTLEYEKLKLSYVQIENENKTNKLRIEQLEELQAKEKGQCEKLLLEVQELRDKLQNVQNDYEQLNSENCSNQDKCLALTRQVEVAKEEMVVLEEKFTKLELSWQEQQQTISDIESQYASVQSKYQLLQTKYEQLENTREQSLSACQRLEKENVELQTEIGELKKKVQNAQQNLLERDENYAKSTKEANTANEELTLETSKIQKENDSLKKQLQEIQTEFKDLQKEYDDLSIQLMDNLQESDSLKQENSNLLEKLKVYVEQVQAVSKDQHNDCNFSMRSSGVCVEAEYEEDLEEYRPDQDLLSKFCELSESLTEIELELIKGNARVFKYTSKHSTPTSYKMYIKNIMGVRKTKKDFDMEIENTHLQGSFKQHSFHIVQLMNGKDECDEMVCDTSDINGCENMTEYVEKLKGEILELKTLSEQEHLRNKSLLESTEKALSEMREQITQLSAELLEKSMFVENCACKTYQQQIESLEKEKADITIICEELQEKVNCTLNNSSNILMNITNQESEIKSLADDKLKELEFLRQREHELLKSLDSQTNSLEELRQRYLDMENDLQTTQQQLKKQDEKYKERCNQLQLENLQKLELSANEYRDNIKKYNKEWEDKKVEYEQIMKNLQQQIEELQKQSNEIRTISESQEDKEKNDETKCDKSEERSADEVQNEEEVFEDIDSIKQAKSRLEEENKTLQEQLNEIKEQFEHMKEENHIQCVEIKLLDSKIVSLEEHLRDSQVLHSTLTRENSSLENQVKDLEEDLNCIPQLHDENQQLTDKVDKLNAEYLQVQEKLQNAEQQITEFGRAESKREEIIKTLQTQVMQLTTLEEKNKNLTRELENLKQEYSLVQEKLCKAEEQVKEFCSEVANRKELIQTLEGKLNQLTALEEEKKSVEIEFEQLRVKEAKNLKEMEILKQELNVLHANISELTNSKSELLLEKNALESKLQESITKNDLLKTDQFLLQSQLSDLNEERKSLNEQCSVLQEEKNSLEEQVKSHKETETNLEMLEQIMKEKAETVQKLYLATEKLERKEKDLLTLQETLSKSLEEKQQQLDKIKQEKEKTKQDNATLYQDLQALKESFNKANQEKQEQQQEIDKSRQDNCQLKSDLQALKDQIAQLDHEKHEQQLEHNNLQQELETFKVSLSKAIENKQQQLNQIENDHQKALQQIQELEEQQRDLKTALNSSNKLTQQLQIELEVTKESLTELENDKQNLSEKIRNYIKLKEDKNNLEITLQKLQSNQSGALKTLQDERDKLHTIVQQYEQQNKIYKEREETLNYKIESLSQQLHEARNKAQSYDKLLVDHEEVEKALSTITVTNQKLQQDVAELSDQRENQNLTIVNLSCEIKDFILQLDSPISEKEKLQTKLSDLKETLQSEKSFLSREYQEFVSSWEELKLKCKSLQTTKTELQKLNQQLQHQYQAALKKLKEFTVMQEELKILKMQHNEVQHKMKITVEEAGRCSLALRKDVEHHKQLLEKQLESYNAMKLKMETNEQTLTKENRRLATNIETLKNEKHSLEEKLRLITVRNFEQDLQRQVIDATANSSIDSNTSFSPKGRKSLERMGLGSEFKAGNNSIEEKLIAIQQKNSTTAERKNRRLSTHDERRIQSFWGVVHDKDTMTDPVDTSCNCLELDRKLKECERDLVIKKSQVTVLNMELKNHPLKDENAALIKRLQEEQNNHRMEIKRYRNKIHDLTVKAENAVAAAAHATAKSQHEAANAELAAEQRAITPVLPKIVANAEVQTTEVQTDGDQTAYIQKLESKYNYIKHICRFRYNTIKQLEEKVAHIENSDGNTLSALDAAHFKVLKQECESLKNELATVKEKYENSKKVLLKRREEIEKLRAQLDAPE